MLIAWMWVFNIVSMGRDCSALRFFSIEVNVKVYHRAGRGWTDVVSTFGIENNCMSLFLTLILTWCKCDNCIYKYTKGKHWNWNFSIDLIHLKTLNDCYMKTTYLIELKLTGIIEQANKSLYTDFQSMLKFCKNLEKFIRKLDISLEWMYRQGKG